MANDLGTRPHGRVWSLDVIRLLTFTAVISVHVLAYTENPGNRAVNGAMLLLQFGREVFFSLTGFVLVYSALGRRIEAWPFWRRRFPFVVVPYLAWSLVYYGVDLLIAPYPSFSWPTLGLDIVDGNAFYHLYFLLVSMQLYLVFPWLVRVVRRTAGHAGLVLAVVGALNMAWLAVLQYVPAPSGTLSWFWNHGYELLPTYAVYVLAGCYAAVHVDMLQALVRRRPGRAFALAAAAAMVAEIGYLAQLGGDGPRQAAEVLQPVMILACIAAVLALAVIGVRWADGPRRGERAVQMGSDISFGVYLAHPLVLTVLLNNGLGNNDQVLPAPLASVLALVGTIAGSVALSWLARRTPLTLLLTGRPRPRNAPPGPSSAVVPAGSVTVPTG